MKSILTRSLVALAATALVATPLWAEEAPSAYDTARASLPWPAADKAFTFDGWVKVGEASMGTVQLSAAPREGAPGWKTSIVMQIDAANMTWSSSTTFDAGFAPVSGTMTQKTSESARTKTWKVTAQSVEIATPGSEAPTVLPQQGAFVTEVTSIFLFSRLTNFAPGTYKTVLFDPDEQRFIAAEWTAGAKGTWGDKPAHLVTGKRADGRTLQAGFDATSGALLGAKMGDAMRTFEFVAGKPPAKEPAKKTGYYYEGAKTAQQASAQAAMSFATANFEVLERVVHWPSVHAQMKEQNADMTESVDELRQQLMAQFRATLKPQVSEELVGPMLQSIAPSLPAEGDENETVVKYPETFRSMTLTVGKRDGVWKLVRLPSKPK